MADWIAEISDVADTIYDTEIRATITPTTIKNEPEPPLPRVGQRYKLVPIEDV